MDYSRRNKTFYPTSVGGIRKQTQKEHLAYSTRLLWSTDSKRQSWMLLWKAVGTGSRSLCTGQSPRLLLEVFQCLHTLPHFFLPKRVILGRFRIYSIVPSSCHLHLCSCWAGANTWLAESNLACHIICHLPVVIFAPTPCFCLRQKKFSNI